MNHTPGPWIPVQHKNGSISIETTNKSTCAKCGIAGTSVVYITRPNCGEVKEQQSNAHLIAAAPELLQALEMMVDVFGFYDSCEEDSNALQKAKAVIVKAKGETI